MMNLLWDEFDISEFFLHDEQPFELEDDDGRSYRATDGVLRAEVTVLPVRRVIAFTIRPAVGKDIIVDLAVVAVTALDRRIVGSRESLYCHECVVVPGLNAYRSLEWHLYYPYASNTGKPVSVLFSWSPTICLQFLDPSPDNRALG